ncbi:MAG TPA: cupin domain-containing protein [Gemmatimonadaceae bacterium]
MKAPLLIPILLLTAGAACAQTSAPTRASAATKPTAQVVHAPPETQWGPVPPALPAGAQIAVLQGNPFAAGVYTLRLKMPNGYTVPPHFHPTDEMVTVISGNLQVGMGDAIDQKAMMKLHAGGFVTAPAQMHHYVIANGETIVQVHGMGPFAITYVNPQDDPRGTAEK